MYCVTSLERCTYELLYIHISNTRGKASRKKAPRPVRKKASGRFFAVKHLLSDLGMFFRGR